MPSASPTAEGFGEPMLIVQDDWDTKETASTAAPSAPKAPQYWDKGTGYGTGPTAQHWDVDDAMSRQKIQEEQATSMLLLMSAFIGGK